MTDTEPCSEHVAGERDRKGGWVAEVLWTLGLVCLAGGLDGS